MRRLIDVFKVLIITISISGLGVMIDNLIQPGSSNGISFLIGVTTGALAATVVIILDLMGIIKL